MNWMEGCELRELGFLSLSLSLSLSCLCHSLRIGKISWLFGTFQYTFGFNAKLGISWVNQDLFSISIMTLLHTVQSLGSMNYLPQIPCLPPLKTSIFNSFFKYSLTTTLSLPIYLSFVILLQYNAKYKRLAQVPRIARIQWREMWGRRLLRLKNNFSSPDYISNVRASLDHLKDSCYSMHRHF